MAGCPPDEFSKNRTALGEPTAEVDKDGYSWWVERLREAPIYDIVIDHSADLNHVKEIPADSENNCNWQVGKRTWLCSL